MTEMPNHTPLQRRSNFRLPATRAVALLAACCAGGALTACSTTLKPEDPGPIAAPPALSTPSATAQNSRNDATSAATQPATGTTRPAASQTKQPAVEPSYIASSAAAGSASVYVQGDSLTVPIKSLLTRLLPHDRLSISAKIGRPLTVGLRLLRQRAAISGLPQVVVMEMGSNDDPRMPSAFAAMIGQTVSVIGNDRCTIWVNLFQRVTKKKGKKLSTTNIFAGLNGVIAAAAVRYKRFSVVDWARTAARNPSWFGPDGVHPNGAGSVVFAQLIAAAINRCKAAGLPSTGLPVDPTGGIAPPA